MGALIQAGATLVATAAAGGLNQYYGMADTSVTTVTANTFGALSSVYTIPAGEAYAGAAYRLTCSGSCVWGSTPESLGLTMWINGTAGGSNPGIAAGAFSASATLRWQAMLEMVCTDGVSAWEVSQSGVIGYAATDMDGLANTSNSVGWADDNPITATVSSAITVAVGARWSSTTGAPTISCRKTIWQKVS